jgi:hypothetical protein
MEQGNYEHEISEFNDLNKYDLAKARPVVMIGIGAVLLGASVFFASRIIRSRRRAQRSWWKSLIDWFSSKLAVSRRRIRSLRSSNPIPQVTLKKPWYQRAVDRVKS